MEPWTLGSENLRAGVPCLGLGDGGEKEAEGGKGNVQLMGFVREGRPPLRTSHQQGVSE